MTACLNTDPTPPDAALALAIVRALGRDPGQGGDHDTQAMVERARQLLQDGVDPNKPCSPGKSFIGLVGEKGSDRPEVAQRLLALLLEHGANPMLLDMALGRILTYDRCPALVDMVLAHLSRCEREGQGLRDARGGNALHYLAEVHQEIGQWQLEKDDMADSGLVVFIDSMINARRQGDGLTPLDVLWHGPVTEWDKAVRGLCWAMTAALLDRGADPLLPRPDGGCVAQTLEALVQTGLDPTPGVEAWPRIEAMLTQARLEARTAQVCATSSMRPRL